MKTALIQLYKRLFVRRLFYPLHRWLFLVGLWGLGCLNSENDILSGEEYFLRHLNQYTPNTDLVIFDVGAHVGGYACRARALHPTAHIYAFEPHPATYATLQNRAQPLGIKTFNQGLGERPGRLPLYNHRANTSSIHASLYQAVIESVHQDQAVADEVEIGTLDDFAQAHQIQHIHLLKIDTEGHELQILQGAQALLQAGAIDVIQFEFNEMNVISRVFFRDFVNLLTGYSFYRLLPDGLVKTQTNPTFLSEIYAFQNIIAIRQR